jgi:hypothetical protein
MYQNLCAGRCHLLSTARINRFVLSSLIQTLHHYPRTPDQPRQLRKSYHVSKKPSIQSSLQPLVSSPLKHSNPRFPCLSNPSTNPSHFRLNSSASRSARHLTHSSTLIPFSSSLKPPAARASCTARDPGVACGDASSMASRSTASQGIEEVMRVFWSCLEGERDLLGERR